MSRDLENRV